MNSIAQQKVVVHANLIDGGNAATSNGHSAIALYYYVRMMDVRGEGRATITIADAAEALKRSPVTIKRYIRQGVANKLFTGVVKRDSGTYTIYYRSLHKVAIELGLESLGAAFEVGIEDLPHLKLLATQAQAQSLQRASRFQRTREAKKGVQRAEEFLAPSFNSGGGKGQILFYGLCTTYVSAEVETFGGSQQQVGEILGRSRRTINRRLNNAYRRKKGLSPLWRKQIAQESREAAVRINGKFATPRFFSRKGRAFKLLCNVYAEDLVLRPIRYSRSKFKRLSTQITALASENAEEAIAVNRNT